MASSPEPSRIKSRRQLACVLRQAAQLEHLLACQYLFAGFTLRKQLSDFPAGGDEAAKQVIITRNQRWGFKVMQIARQEMEHLGIVTNLLGAIGEAPYFDRPNFPLPATLLPIDTPFLLQRFGRATLERFLAYERPDFLQVPDSWRAGGPRTAASGARTAASPSRTSSSSTKTSTPLSRACPPARSSSATPSARSTTTTRRSPPGWA